MGGGTDSVSGGMWDNGWDKCTTQTDTFLKNRIH
jgi:hypothetical protein